MHNIEYSITSKIHNDLQLCHKNFIGATGNLGYILFGFAEHQHQFLYYLDTSNNVSFGAG